MTIEERAKEAGIVSQYKSDYRYDARSVESGYMQGAKEQKDIDDEATLKGFTTDELRAELKRRAAEEKAKKESVLRCRMCKHWGKISYWGRPITYIVGGDNRSCEFFKTKNGKYYRCHRASQLACEHFERKEEQL